MDQAFGEVETEGVIEGTRREEVWGRSRDEMASTGP